MFHIFDDFERTDPAPASDMESSYRFLNRVARPEWERVRSLIEDWFSKYPVDAQADLRSRLQDDDYVQHIGAWWELYSYTLFRRLGYHVSIHPTLKNTSRQPDFLVARGEVSMYVECVIFLSGLGPMKGQGSGERSWIFEATNQASNPNFMVDIEIRQSGKERPKASEIFRPLESWLSSLDPNEVAEQNDARTGIPALVLTVRGWIIEYCAFPVNPESRGAASRLIGSYPTIGGSINNDTLRYRNLVSRKGRHYGQPDKPFVVAVLNTSGFLDQDEVAEALFGLRAVEYYEGQSESLRVVRRRDGYWRQGPQRRGTRVSGLLDGENIYPWRVSAQMPKLWVNPWAEKPLADPLPFTTITARDTGEVHQIKNGTSADAVFGLNTDWPGFAR